MTTTVVEFGYFPHSLDFSSVDFEIATLPSLSGKITSVVSNNNVEGDWLYSPFYSSKPYPSRIFGLPKTHMIFGNGLHREEEFEFYVWVLSFLEGMRFTTTEMGFLDSTPVKKGKLVDFILANSEVVKAFEKIRNFWHTRSADRQTIKLVLAALNSLYFSQHPKNLQFEEFNYLYLALDSLYRLTAKIKVAPSRLPHAERVAWTCAELGTNVPAWATGNPTTISEIRNALMHEALFANAPVGFGTLPRQSQRGSNLCLEMRKLVCRFLISIILGSSYDYVASSVSDRMQRQLTI